MNNNQHATKPLHAQRCTVQIMDTGPNRYCQAAIVRDENNNILAEIRWTMGYGRGREDAKRAECIARAHMYAAAPGLFNATEAIRERLIALEHVDGSVTEVPVHLLRALLDAHKAATAPSAEPVGGAR